MALLNSLELEWPHVFAVPAGRLGAGTPRPWVPCDTTEKEVLRAFKKASLQLHPDRLISARRDLSVVIEAEEVLKVLNEAQGSKKAWLQDPPAGSASSVKPPTTRQPQAAHHPNMPAPAESRANTSKEPSHRPTCAQSSSGASLREDVFGSFGAASASAPAPPHHPASTQQARAQAAMDTIFGQASVAPTEQAANDAFGTAAQPGADCTGWRNTASGAGTPQARGNEGDAGLDDMACEHSRRHPFRKANTAGNSIRDAVFGLCPASSTSAGTGPAVNPFERVARPSSPAPPMARQCRSMPSAAAAGQSSPRAALDDLFCAPASYTASGAASGASSGTSGGPDRCNPFSTAPAHGPAVSECARSRFDASGARSTETLPNPFGESEGNPFGDLPG